MKIKRNDSVDDLIEQYATAKAYLADAEAQVKYAGKKLTEYMAANQRKSLSRKDGGKIYRVTYVQNTSTQINEEGLKKALGAKQFHKLTTEKLDRKKLSDAMDSGEVDPMIVGAHVTEKLSAPFIRFTEGVDKEDES